MKENHPNLLKEIIDEFFNEIEKEKIINDMEVLNNFRNLFLSKEIPNVEFLEKTLFPVRTQID